MEAFSEETRPSNIRRYMRNAYGRHGYSHQVGPGDLHAQHAFHDQVLDQVRRRRTYVYGRG
jgi:hypothetical protein